MRRWILNAGKKEEQIEGEEEKVAVEMDAQARPKELDSLSFLSDGSIFEAVCLVRLHKIRETGVYHSTELI